MKFLKHKKIYIFISIFFIIIAMFFSFKTEGAIDWTEDFPDSYKPYIKELAKKHPNWRFIPLYTNLDWNYVIQEENKFGTNLVPLNYSDSWKNTTPGQYNIEIDAGWVDSSKQAVEYCMDPRNFLNETRIFQFEELSYDETINSLEGIEKILYGTEFYKRKVNYMDSNGNNISTNENYSDLILKAAKISYVNPYHLASRIKQEVGPFLTHNSISGTVEGFKGLYNFYNIGATSSAEPMGAIKNGLQYAKDGKGASEAIKNKYLIPWNTKEKAIVGGGIFIGSSYINVGQNTIYLQKFDVTDTTGDGLFWHQYMTNVLAPYSESKSIYNGYKQAGILDTSINFIIPIYNNMPEIPTESPNINKSDYRNDNTRVYCDASNVNIRTGPGTSYDIITTVTKQEMTRIKNNVNSGGWVKVQIDNGIMGYILGSYVTEVQENKDIIFDNSLRVEQLEISGIDYTQNTVEYIKGLITTDYEIEILNNKNQVLNNTDLIGTGTKIRIKNNREVVKEFHVLLYGDVNGDGKISSVDLLVLQRHILEMETLGEFYQKAGNINKNPKGPSSIDLLLIQRHILELQIIKQ